MKLMGICSGSSHGEVLCPHFYDSVGIHKSGGRKTGEPGVKQNNFSLPACS